jgi:hypothetical protein
MFGFDKDGGYVVMSARLRVGRERGGFLRLTGLSDKRIITRGKCQQKSAQGFYEKSSV